MLQTTHRGTLACDSVGQPGDPDQAWLTLAGFIRASVVSWRAGCLASQHRLGNRETGPLASPHPAGLLTWDWDQTSLPSYWVGHNKSQGESDLCDEGGAADLHCKWAWMWAGVKTGTQFYISLTHVHRKPEWKAQLQHLTNSKSLSVVRLWGFKGEGGFI